MNKKRQTLQVEKTPAKRLAKSTETRPAGKPAKDIVRHILVPIDFSDSSASGLIYAASMAGAFGARLTLLHVVEPMIYAEMPSLIPTGRVESSAALAAETRQKLTEFARGNLPAATIAESSVEIGRPSVEIVAAAERLGANLIIMSAHRRAGVVRSIMGSTAERVVRHANCPVLVLHEKDRADHPG